MNSTNHCTCRNCQLVTNCNAHKAVCEMVKKEKHFNTQTNNERPTVGVLNTVFYKLAECCTKFKLNT